MNRYKTTRTGKTVSSDNTRVIKKNLLIIKSKNYRMDGVKQFLENREWRVYITTDLKVGLEYMLREQPAFVMISMDHPAKAVRKLPRVLPQVSQACIIPFAENSTSSSSKTLTEVGSKFSIFPPVTGPAIERTVFKYLQGEKPKPQKPDASHGSFEAVDSESGTTISSRQYVENEDENTAFISGKVKSASEMQILSNRETHGSDQMMPGSFQMSGAAGSAGGMAFDMKALTSLLEGADTSSSETSAGDVSGGETSHRQGQNEGPQGQGSGSDGGSGSGTGHFLTADNEGREPGNREGSAGWRLPKRTDHQKGNAGGTLIALNQKEKARGQGPVVGNLSTKGSSDDSQNRTNGQPKVAGNAGSGGVAKATGNAGILDQGSPNNLNVNRAGKNSNANQGPNIRVNTGGKWGDDSLIAIGTKKALAQSSEPPAETLEKLGSANNVACIAVESPRFAGYLVTAFGHQRKIDENFVTLVKDRLFKFLTENGENVSREEQMNITIKEVAFEAWSLECAEFLRKSIHKGTEVAMAFFPNTKASTKVGASKDERMASVKIEDLKGDTQVEFNLYLYLASNDKYILYTPKGAKFYEKQRSKLLTSGVKDMHVEKEAVEEFSRYKAQNYLNDRVDEFEERKKSKSRKKDSA